MDQQPTFLITDPSHFNVSYAINPWMDPERWSRDPDRLHHQAISASQKLDDTLVKLGCHVELVPGVPGLPDMVFPANAAVVLDGVAIGGRFRHRERRGEESAFMAVLDALAGRGLLKEVRQLPERCFQEGAGDCMWDEARGLFWSAYGPRSSRKSIDLLSMHFEKEIVPLELVSNRCYHLDVCFCPLSGGEILYFPEALSEPARQLLQNRVPAQQLISATEEDLRNFSLNAVCIGRNIVMTRATETLKCRLVTLGYVVHEVDLSPFMMSGGGAFCMTLRLDHSSQPRQANLVVAETVVSLCA